MAATGSRYDVSGTGLLPSAILGPYGEKALQYGIGQLGTSINPEALSPQVAGQSAFQQKAAQGLADMSGLGSIQRDASGQVVGFTGGTGVASYQPYLTAGAGFNQTAANFADSAAGFGTDAAGFAQNAVGFGTDAASFGQNAAGFNTAAANLADPSQDYQAFMSPYQQQIIDTTLADYDRQSQISKQGISQNALTAGAFGGSRQGVAEAEYQSNSDRNRTAVLAGLYGQGYNQAQDLRQQAMGNQLNLGAGQLGLGANQLNLGNNQLNLGNNQLGLGANQLNLANSQLGLGALQNQMAQFVPGLESQRVAGLEALGAQDQVLEQSKLNAITTANQTAYQLPMQRISDYANIYGTIAGAMPGQQQGPGFRDNPIYTGIGGFANVMGAFGNAAQSPQAPGGNVTGGYTGFGGGYGRDPNDRMANGGRAYRRGGRVRYGKGGIVSYVQ